MSWEINAFDKMYRVVESFGMKKEWGILNTFEILSYFISNIYFILNEKIAKL